jgi:methyl-accepting chemotaxis protein
VKLNNLTIAPKLGILVGVTLLGLCVSGAVGGYLMQQEMFSARVDQTRAIVEIVRNMTGCAEQRGSGREDDEGGGARPASPARQRDDL